MSISEFIAEKYRVVFQGDIVRNLDDVEEFLLTEDHDKVGHQIINSQFINSFAEPSDFVLIETVASMQFAKEDESPTLPWLNRIAPIVGWDVIDGLAEMAAPKVKSSFLETVMKARVRVETLLRAFTEAGSKECEEKIQSDLGPVFNEACDLEEQAKFDPECIMMKRMEASFLRRQHSLIDSLTLAKDKGVHRFLIAGGAHLDHDQKAFSEDYITPVWDFLKSRNAVILVPEESAVERESGKLRGVLRDLHRQREPSPFYYS